MTDYRELELKLSGNRNDLRKVETNIRRIAGPKAAFSDDTMRSVYYDTADLRLRTRGVEFRVRKSAKGFIQTVKAKVTESDSMALERAEWDMPVSRITPDLDALTDPARLRMGLVLPGELRKLFQIDVERRKIKLAVGEDDTAATIEIAIDRGSVSASRRKQEFSQLELELLDGDWRQLTNVAQQITKGTGLWVCQETKASMGLTLLHGREPVAVKAPGFLANGKATVAGTLDTVFRACLKNVLLNEEATLDGSDIEGVHQMRVSARRMRSALSTFRKYIDPEKINQLKDELKWFASSLGPARDWDVFCDETMSTVSGFGIDADRMTVLKEQGEVRRAAGYEIVRQSVRSARYTALVLEIFRIVENSDWGKIAHETIVGDVAAILLKRSRRKLLKAGEDIETMSIADRHEVRILVKKFRYTVDFLATLYPRDRVRPMMKQLSRLQDDFGHLNDVVVAEGLVDELAASKGLSAAERQKLAYGAGQLLGWYARGVAEDDAHFVGRWNAFATATPFWIDDRKDGTGKKAGKGKKGGKTGKGQGK